MWAAEQADQSLLKLTWLYNIMRWILSFSLIWILDSFLYGTSAATSSIWSMKISSGLLLRDSGKSSSLKGNLTDVTMAVAPQRGLLPIRIKFGIFRLPAGCEWVSTLLYVALKYAVAFLLVVIEPRQLLCFVLLLKTIHLLINRLEHCLDYFLLPSESELSIESSLGAKVTRPTHLSEIVNEKSR